MLTFSHTLSFAFLHSTGSPGTMLGKGDDNEYGKGKSNKGKGMDYSEQLFLTHSFCPSTGSQCHARWVMLGRVRSGQVEWGPVRSSRVKSGPVRLGRQVMGSGCWVRSGWVWSSLVGSTMRTATANLARERGALVRAGWFVIK
jgi:hypothetical protein